jgi:hypothetical protein
MMARTLLVFPMFLLVACTENSYDPTTVKEVVVDGCLVAGAPVDSVRCTLLVPYGGDVQEGASISGAIVTISDGATEWPLTALGDSGYYHCGDSSFLPREDSAYTITILYNGKNISARTVVPRKPTGLSLSVDTLYIDTTLSMMEMMQQMREDSGKMVFSFENYDSAYYFVVVENVDSTPVDLQTDTFFFNGPRFLSRPFKGNEYLISFMQIKQLGRHKVTLYRVNQEYVDLYDNRNQDSRNLNEPKTNVVNGLGIFTAVNCDSVFFYASPKQ